MTNVISKYSMYIIFLYKFLPGKKRFIRHLENSPKVLIGIICLLYLTEHICMKMLLAKYIMPKLLMRLFMQIMRRSCVKRNFLSDLLNYKESLPSSLYIKIIFMFFEHASHFDRFVFIYVGDVLPNRL